jgi:hypothetical protein
MTNREILIGFLFSAMSGFGVWLIQQIILNRKEKKYNEQKKIVKFHNEERVIDESIFTALSPGASVELMRSVLGTPNTISKYDSPIFTKSYWSIEEDVNESDDETGETKTNSFLYRFKNATVKLTSKDNENIDSLTVLVDDTSISFDGLIFPWSNDEQQEKFWKTKVTKEMVEECESEFIQTMRDRSFVLSLNVGSPLYRSYTYFGFVLDDEKDMVADNPESFIGGLITGVCISDQSKHCYYIYDYELR